MMTEINTRSQSFSYSFESAKPPETVFEWLLDVGAWWSGLYEETIIGVCKKVDDEFSFTAGGGVHYSKQKLIELVPHTRIVWLVSESNLTFLSDPGEWVDTKIRFDISHQANRTTVTFTHEGLNAGFECYENCSVAWAGYMKKLETNLK